MLTTDEEKFVAYWKVARLAKKSFSRQLLRGLPIGMMMGIGILVCFESGWYTRANMVANSQSTPYALIVAIVGIVVFCSIFFQRHQWEMKEQQYIELLIKKQKAKLMKGMQQEGSFDGQSLS